MNYIENARIVTVYKAVKELARANGGAAPVDMVKAGKASPREIDMHLRALTLLEAIAYGEPVPESAEARCEWYARDVAPSWEARPSGAPGLLRALILSSVRCTYPPGGCAWVSSVTDRLKDSFSVAEVKAEIQALARLGVFELLPSHALRDVTAAMMGGGIQSGGDVFIGIRVLPPLAPPQVRKVSQNESERFWGMFRQPDAKTASHELARAANADAEDWDRTFRREIFGQPGGLAYEFTQPRFGAPTGLVWAAGAGDLASLSILKSTHMPPTAARGQATLGLAEVMKTLAYDHGKTHFIASVRGGDAAQGLLERLGFTYEGGDRWSCTKDALLSACAGL